MNTIILGSSSKRRQELLKSLNIPFEIKPSHFDEETVLFNGNPEAYVCELSEKKSLAIDSPLPILTADTAVFCGGQIFNKPKDREDAEKMLAFLSGRPQEVWTGVTVRQGKRRITRGAVTGVLFNPLSDEQIHNYLDSIVWHDKSGSYTLEGKGALIVRRIDGCFYNVLGLPISLLPEMLLPFGIDLWKATG